MAASSPELVRAGGTSLTIKWKVPADGLQAEYRRTVWLVPGAWVPCELPEGSVYSETEDGEEVAHVTLRGLEQRTVYDVRLISVRPAPEEPSAGGSDGGPSPPSSSEFVQVVSRTAQFSTLELVPRLLSAPEVKCARFDRLLLRWAGPVADSEEVLAYRVRYFDHEGRWPVRTEIEVKLASRLLRRSEQMTQFLSGLVALRNVPPIHHGPTHSPPAGAGGAFGVGPGGCGGSVASECAESEEVEDESAEVHFWLLNLVPARRYYVQAAAVTAAGPGEWSPKSGPLYTWRVAPTLQVPRPMLNTHASVAVRLALEPLTADTHGQDEEVESFEVVVQRLRDGSEAQRLTISKAEAQSLSKRLLEYGEAEADPASPSNAISSFAVAVPGLAPSTYYTCQARAVTHAGVGEFSLPCDVETLPVPPEVVDLKVHKTLHDSVAISWRVVDPCAAAGLVQACLSEEEAGAELAARHVVGFKIRLAEGHGGGAHRNWREVISVRMRPGPCSAAAGCDMPEQEFTLQGLAHTSQYRLQVSAVAVGGSDGQWSNAVELSTEPLAPALNTIPAADALGRSWAVLTWPAPPELLGAPVLGYVAAVSAAKSRRASDVYECFFEEDGTAPADRRQGVAVWREGDDVKLSVGRLEPDSSYTVQVAARTERGVGPSMSCALQTCPIAPSMSTAAPELVRAYCNRLQLRCEGPVPDWRPEDGRDITGFHARYYDVGGGRVFSAPWHMCDVAFEYGEDGKSVNFNVEELLPEREYVVQIAAATEFGRGQWSAESEPLRTWRLAPPMTMPQVMLRTHTAMVLGWTVDTSEEATGANHEEEVTEFAIHARHVMPGGSPSMREESSAMVRREQAAEFAQLLRRNGVLELAPERDIDDDGPMCSYGQDILCDGFGSVAGLEFVAVIRDLEPDQAYTCAVRAVTRAGVGHPSPHSVPHSTLPVAPKIEDLQLDEVQHDRIQVSWITPRLKPPLAQFAIDDLGLRQSVEELDLQGIEVRCAAWRPWTRLNWQEPALMERPQLRSDASGRGFTVVENLDAERQYVVELRARGARGPGTWCRVNNQRVCTAVDMAAPEAPELVKNTAHSLTFSFAGLEDRRIVAYEVRRYEGWAGAGSHASAPVKFDAMDSCVRVTSERRWVVTLSGLRSETTHALQLRGVTQSKGITKWSPWSERMSTLPETDGLPEADGVASLARADSPAATVGAQRQATKETESIEALAAKLEAMLRFALDYFNAGVQLPTVTVPSVSERAAALLRDRGGSAQASLDVLLEREDDAFWTTKLPDFLIHQAPVAAGCSTLLLRELWHSVRRCAIVAHLFGRDAQSSETRALLLLCLVPPGSEHWLEGAGIGHEHRGATADEPLVLRAVSKALARETFSYASTNRSGLHGLSLLEVAGLVLRDYRLLGLPGSPRGLGADRLLSERAPPGAASSTAGGGPPPFFEEAATGLSEAAVEDTGPPTPARVARALFEPPKREEHPAAIVGLLALWMLPLFVSLCRIAAKRVPAVLSHNVQMDLSLAGLALGLMFLWALGAALVVWVQANIDRVFRIPSTFVFVAYASAPGMSIWLATRSVLRGLTVAPCFALLGLYSLGTGYLRWADDLLDDSTLERREVPRLVWGRRRQRFAVKAHSILWLVLVADFLFEEVLGRWIGLHDWRLLGPAFNRDRRGGAPFVEADVPPEFQSPAFALLLAAAGAHYRVLSVTKRHAALVRLLGARRERLPFLRLFFMGAPSLAWQHTETLDFLKKVSLSRRWCCVVLFLRRWGAAGGVLIPLSLYVLRDARYLGALPKDTVVTLAVGVGVVLGHSASSSFAALWAEYEELLEADCRVLYLFPHMSSKARDRACDALSAAFRLGSIKEEEAEVVGPAKLALRAAQGALSFAMAGVGMLLHMPSVAVAPTGAAMSGTASDRGQPQTLAGDAADGTLRRSRSWSNLRRRPSL